MLLWLATANAARVAQPHEPRIDFRRVLAETPQTY